MDSITRDRAFIANPLQWPCWPLLPMKRRNPGAWDQSDYCGLLYADGQPKVYLTNLFGLGWHSTPKNWSKALASIPVKEYDDFDALLADYQVD